MFKLVIQDDEGKTTVVPLIRDEITIGRKEGNTIRLTERNVSRRHARIVRANGAVSIEDLNSYNGVRVNGSRIQGRTGLSVSDRVQIGDYLIELKLEGVEAVDPYGDQKTQPIERIDPMLAASHSGLRPGNGAPGHVGPAALADTDPGLATAPPMIQIPSASSHPHLQSGPQAGTHASGSARLVILSSNFAGRDFELTKPAMVIGRTDDNDIVVNHRSISRHHAKVVREPDTGRFTISDLQSANGVRVNGEEYGKVELRRGDIVDLGHVRMRFVEPGEDFLFGRDAQAVDIGGGGGKGLMIGILALLVIGGGIGVFVAMSGGDDKGPAVAEGTGSAGTGSSAGSSPGTAAGTNPGTGSADPGSGSAIAMTDTPDAAAAEPGSGSAAVAAVDTNPAVAKALEEANRALASEDWASVQQAARSILDKSPGNAQAKALDEQARKEIAANLKYKDFEAAARKKDYAGAKRLFDGIPQDSVYKDRGRDTYDKLHDEYVAEKVKEAKKLVAQNKCKDLKKLIVSAGKVWSDAGDAVAREEGACKETVATNPGTGSGSSGSGTGSSGSGTGSGSGSSSGATFTQVVADARQAIKDSQYGRALRLGEQALGMNRSDPEALTICAIAACQLKNESKAKTYIGKLPNERKSMARQYCLRNGINIP
jgi:pSer/pThr/pTyr-binding forkhead associated (FHA) protein